MRAYVAIFLTAFVAGAALAHLLAPSPADEPPHFAPAEGPPHFARTFDATRFLRGNLHTHTTLSDGDASPYEVAQWYAAHGYDFLALTDHNVLSYSRDSTVGEDGAITLLAGEEVSMWVQGKQVHVNALCIHDLVPAGTFPTVAEALAHAVTAIRDQDGIALLNHPNFDWALGVKDVVSAEGFTLLEIASGHPYVHAAGDATHASDEALWDDALSAGHDVMGVAVDDTHHLLTDADPEAFPGVAWVEVFADTARPEVICDALRRGALYASTGAELASIEVTPDAYTVVPLSRAAKVVFVGAHGRVLATDRRAEGRARYTPVGDEGYVRARVETSRGTAWTPAVRVTRALR